MPGADPFGRTFEFPDGVVIAVGPSLRGKASILEIITWCLRGTPRELQQDVTAWLQAVECDVEINNAALGVRLMLDDGEVVEGTIYPVPSFLAPRPGAAAVSPQRPALAE